MKVRNKELQDELKHVMDQLRAQPTKSTAMPVAAAATDRQNVSQQNISSRYTFSSNPANNKSTEIQPKGILKKREDQQSNRPISASNFYNEEEKDEGGRSEDDRDDEHQSDEEDEDEEVNYGGEPAGEAVPNKKSISFSQNNEPEQAAQSQPAASEEEEFDMKFPAQYHNKNQPNMRVVEQIIGHDGKI